MLEDMERAFLYEVTHHPAQRNGSGHDAQLLVQSWEQRTHLREDSSASYCIWNVVCGLNPLSPIFSFITWRSTSSQGFMGSAGDSYKVLRSGLDL